MKYLVYVIEYDGGTSLIASLKKRSWAINLRADISRGAGTGFEFLKIFCDLTETGLGKIIACN